MKCPACVEAGERSEVYPQGCGVTCMGWSPHYDEDGNYHTHNPNKAGGLFRCSNGHRFVGEWKPCGSCDWGYQPAKIEPRPATTEHQ